MAKALSPFIFFSLLISSTLSVILVTAENYEDHVFGRSLDPKLIVSKKQKLSHFRFYWHDIVSGPKPTAVKIVPPPANTSASGFGFVAMIDDPITIGPELSSKLVGRAQGFYASASQQEVSLLMSMNFAFIEGKYNGSTITVLGRNPVFHTVREMPVIGGSGLFRFARVMFRLELTSLISSQRTLQWSTIFMFCIIDVSLFLCF